MQAFSLHPMNQQMSPCYPSFLTVTESYDSKVTPIGALYAEKISEAVLLYVFRITIPASPLARVYVKFGLSVTNLILVKCCSSSDGLLEEEKIL